MGDCSSHRPEEEWQESFDKLKAAFDEFVTAAYGPNHVITDWTSVAGIMNMDNGLIRYARPGSSLYPHASRGLLHQALLEMDMMDMAPDE